MLTHDSQLVLQLVDGADGASLVGALVTTTEGASVTAEGSSVTSCTEGASVTAAEGSSVTSCAEGAAVDGEAHLHAPCTLHGHHHCP